jgi:Xaa-Pro aminopeptidase
MSRLAKFGRRDKLEGKGVDLAMTFDGNKPVTTSYDLPVSEPLRQLMRQGWDERESEVIIAHESAPWSRQRRAKLSALFPGKRIIIPAGRFKVRNNDCDYTFRANSAFIHLTGMVAGDIVPESILLFEPTPTGHEVLLFVHPKNDRNLETFYRDRRHGEFWVGRYLSLAEITKKYQISARNIKEFDEFSITRKETLVHRGEDLQLDSAIAEHEQDDELAIALSELRLVKDSYEIGEMRKAVAATIRGFADVVRSLPEAIDNPRGERVIDGTFYKRARVEGNELGYNTIAAAGPHACVLHWIRNDGPALAGDLLLLDAGVEIESHYTADITRTLPINGKFTPTQRELYEIVLAAQEAGIRAVEPGAKYRDINNACMNVLAEGLERLGVLTISAAESIDPGVGLHRRWSVHASGHMLGIDVHDCAKARGEQYLDGKLAVGHVLTVEPGLYIQPDDLLFPEEYRGIGIRIEDDVLVTEDKVEVLSRELPRDPDSIESWMASLL